MSLENVEEIGIKETRELLVAVNELVIFLIHLLKDGVQGTDFIDLYKKVTEDDAFRIMLLEAYSGIRSVPSEMKDIDVYEAVALSSLQLSYLPRIIEQIKDKPNE